MKRGALPDMARGAVPSIQQMRAAWTGQFALSLVNTSLGLRDGSWDLSFWVRNLTNENYLQNVTVQAGNSGLVLGRPGDPRMSGVTLRATL